MLNGLFTYEFIQNAFIAGLLIGLLAPLLGVFVVVRRLSLIADALSHITLAGIAASLLIEKKLAIFHVNPLYMGMTFSVIGSLFIEKLRKVYKYYQELAIPIILSGGIGLGVIFISLADGFNTDLFNYLFGSINAVSRADMYTVIGITVIVLFVIVLTYKELFSLSFDEEHAVAAGVKTKFVNFLFIIMVALVIAASMRIVGILLVSSLMTLPVASSMRLSTGFKMTIFLSIIFGEIAVIGGLFLAYHLSLAPGGTIVMISVLILIVTIASQRWRGKVKS
jgi:zinc transport system permease protein